MWKKEELFLTMEYELVSVEEMMELENHHLAAIIIIIDLGKNHQMMLKNRVKGFLHSQSSTVCFLIMKKKKDFFIIVIES